MSLAFPAKKISKGVQRREMKGLEDCNILKRKKWAVRLKGYHPWLSKRKKIRRIVKVLNTELNISLVGGVTVRDWWRCETETQPSAGRYGTSRVNSKKAPGAQAWQRSDKLFLNWIALHLKKVKVLIESLSKKNFWVLIILLVNLMKYLKKNEN